MLKPNVGHINYLNCLPLTYTFTKNPSDKFNLFKDVPANLIKQSRKINWISVLFHLSFMLAILIN